MDQKLILMEHPINRRLLPRENSALRTYLGNKDLPFTRGGPVNNRRLKLSLKDLLTQELKLGFTTTAGLPKKKNFICSTFEWHANLITSQMTRGSWKE